MSKLTADQRASIGLDRNTAVNRGDTEFRIPVGAVRSAFESADRLNGALVIRVARSAGLVALFVVAALLGILSGVLFAYAGDLPQISRARRLPPEHDHARLRARRPGDRRVRHRAPRRRRLRRHHPALRQAIIATEDADFNRHFGLNSGASRRRGVHATSSSGRRAQGASTLTQQLARNLFKDQFGLTEARSRSSARSRRSILAIQIEKRYTKHEIFTSTATRSTSATAPTASRPRRGCTSTSPNKELTLEEAALIAGIIQTPERQSPFVDMKRATQRRNYRAAADGRRALHHAGGGRRGRSRSRSSRAASRRSRRASRRSSSRRSASTSSSSTARRCCTRTASRCTTTLDAELQEAANRAHRARPARASTSATATASRSATCSPKATRSTAFKDERWTRPIAAGDVVPAVVVDRRRRAGRGARAHRRATTPTCRARASRGRGERRPPISSSRAISIEVAITKLDEAANDGDGRRSSRRRSSRARCSRSTTAPARSRRWSAAGASAAASSTAPCRRTGRWARRSSRSSTRPRSIAASRRRRSSIDDAGELSAGQRTDLQPAQLRPQVRRADHAAPGARRFAQHPGDQDDGHARAEERARVRRSVRVRGGLPAVPADRARRGRRDAARSDERLHRVPEPGRAHEAVRRAEGAGPRRQPARGEPRRADRRRSAPTRRS